MSPSSSCDDAVILCDVNVLLFAYMQQSKNHEMYRAWLNRSLDGDESFGVSDQVLSGVVRISTNRHAMKPASGIEEALQFASAVRSHPNSIVLSPGPRHWGIFTRLCREVGATGNDVPDAYFAALAIEHGCEWITASRGFARFPGLRWRHPLTA